MALRVTRQILEVLLEDGERDERLFSLFLTPNYDLEQDEDDAEHEDDLVEHC